MPVPLMDTTAQYESAAERISAAIAAIIGSGRFVLGPSVERAESELARATGSAHAVGVANGTDAISIALEALGVGPGDEVVCPSYTFFATAEAIAQIGAVPVFADVDPQTMCLDPDAAAAAVTSRTAAIVPVDLFGHPAAFGELTTLAQRHGLALLEDAAQAFGAALDGTPCGALADAATFSFYPTKNLPCFGDGGLITTSRDEVAETARVLRFHGSRDKRTFERIGYNSRLDEIQAAVLLELLPLVEGWNDARIAAAARYDELGLGELVELPSTAPGARHVYHLYMVRSPQRERLREELAARGIGAAVYYGVPLHRQPAFAHLGYEEGSLPATERAAREALALPMFPTIDADQQAEVVEALRAAAVLR